MADFDAPTPRGGGKFLQGESRGLCGHPMWGQFGRYEVEIIKSSKESLLFNNGKCWVKKSDKNFDITIGSLDGAETSELVGLYLLNKIKDIIPQENLGLYRDDGLGVIKNANGQKLDRIRKKLHACFQSEGLKITVENSADFLDIALDLANMSYKPYKKPNDTPSYVHIKSNHPPIVIKNIPSMISKRLSSLSSNIEVFNDSKQEYKAALGKSGYLEPISYQENLQKKKRCRKMKIIWFNPPYSSNVATDIGRKFFGLIEKHFPKKSPLHQIINKNTVKLSYCCNAKPRENIKRSQQNGH